MPFCPKCGKEVAKEAEFCYYCGESLPKAKPSNAPTIVTAEPPITKEEPKKSLNTRYFIIAGIVVVAIIIVAVYFGASILVQSTFVPAKFQSVTINGGPSDGVYTVAFSLLNDKDKTGVANGTVIFTIVDGRSTQLFQTTRNVKISDYSNGIYSWSFPSSEVNAGVPPSWDAFNEGYATIKFVTTTGTIISNENYMVKISVVPTVKIEHLEMNGNAPIFGGYVSFPPYTNQRTFSYYASETLNFTIHFAEGSPFIPDINNIWIVEPGFSVISVDPSLPIPNSATLKNVNIIIRTPSQAYQGNFTVFLNFSVPPGYVWG